MQLPHDRADAGRRLAQRLESFRGQDVVVIGLPRGGVPVAIEVAKALEAPLDFLVVRKLRVPFQSELAFGAIAEGGVRVINDAVLEQTGLTDAEITEVDGVELAGLQRQVDLYRPGREPVPLAGRVALIVDDGFVTGATAKAACEAARARGAAQVVFAAPLGSPDAVDTMRSYADEVVFLEAPAFYFYAAMGQGYRRFREMSDGEVIALLDGSSDGSRHIVTSSAKARPPLRDEEVRVTAGPVSVAGHLTIPEHPIGIVIFAHGSGSSRHSPRNRYIVKVLNNVGLATLLFDLLTTDEESDRANVFDIRLLAGRLIDVTGWLAGQPDTAALPVGYFGAGTGAGAALVAATDRRVKVEAVVSRGGRPDLAGGSLRYLHAPTLLLVGGHDDVVLELNRQAEAAIPGKCELVVVPGATHLFEEPGALEQVAMLAGDWFHRHLSRSTLNAHTA
jgi:putative phosphoribosyl transferase